MKRLLVLGFVVATAAFGQCQTFYGLSSTLFGPDPAKLWSVDRSTGKATFLRNVTLADGSPVQTSVVGLANLNGTLYACDCFNSTGNTFGSIDPLTGVFTPIGNQNGSLNWWALAADPSSGTLYTVEREDTQAATRHLYTLNTADGSTTDLGHVVDANGDSVTLSELAFDTKTNTLYGLDWQNLYTVNLSTLVASLVTNQLPGFGGFSDLVYDAETDKLYENVGDGGGLWAIDPVTGATTFIGSNGVPDIIDGLAAGPTVVPEPASLLILGLGTLGLAARRRFRKRPR